ncbi:MAG TPA: cohesin domain-containing protein [Desulfobacteria bacterium]|nr:cohesin domain-containing protein [Desulfobacteria bacterium]
MKREKGSGDVFRFATVASVVIVMLILSASSAVVAASSTSVSIGSATVNVGESVTLPLMLENAAEEISCATINLSYDNAVAQVTSASTSGFDAFVYNADNALGKTTIVVYQTGESGLTGTIKIADVTITGVGSGSSSLNLQIETLKNNAGDPVSADVVSGSFTVKSSGGGTGGNGGSGGSVTTPTPTPSPSQTPSPNVTGTPSPSPSPSPSQPEEPGIVTVRVGDVIVGKDEETTVTITINNVGGEGLSSARMNLTFDPKIAKVLSAENREFYEFMSNIEKGQVNMIGYQTGAEGLKGDVVFAEIQVKAVGKTNDRTELRLEVTELTDNVGNSLTEHEDFEVVSGYFLIQNAAASGPEPAGSEPSKPLIPTFGVVETLAVIIGAFFVIKRTRKE